MWATLVDCLFFRPSKIYISQFLNQSHIYMLQFMLDGATFKSVVRILLSLAISVIQIRCCCCFSCSYMISCCCNENNDSSSPIFIPIVMSPLCFASVSFLQSDLHLFCNRLIQKIKLLPCFEPLPS